MVADRRRRLMFLLKFQQVSTPMEKKNILFNKFQKFHMFLLLFNAFKVYTDAFYEKIHFLIFQIDFLWYRVTFPVIDMHQ